VISQGRGLITHCHIFLQRSSYIIITMEAPCCPPGSWGAVAPPAEYKNKGSMEAVGKIKAYVVRPSTPSNKALICVPDIFGLDSGRTKAICDDYSEKLGCLVIMPDILGNDVYDMSWGWPNANMGNMLWFMRWCTRHNPNKEIGVFKANVKPFLEKEKIEKFACFTFCWGALIGAALSALPECKGQVGFHPSYNAFQATFFASKATILGSIKCPQLYLPGNNDIVKPNGEFDTFIREKTSQEVTVHVYEKEMHGFVNRGDVSNPDVAKDVQAALEEGEVFLTKVLA